MPRVYSPPSPQLRYLQTLNSISAENNSTIVFPLPVDILANMIRAPQVRMTYLLPDLRNQHLECLGLIS